ncbi:microsomal epoxide hydrolase [Fusarium oxysporum f. sp. lycopersici 4287]|uniref:Microsomal epoxide hydrolase n=3 Tax=Fusarium oxysporum TaxID=5507 RepID=A0A0J9V977_FUSO4|nr:microsomal epoxide hydrolase [Fusarium oxysporum f. sp. lycopersici 4287]EXK32439.1 microsomal epoxide hydrolase [Fusarium oxysporum f. sp. melonis 26406]KAJ9424133.1 microsomal epoxide hydrolase [Fusarium oxysporum]KNB07526.1 microsomal epoxide hydrolase [Fusarium oxysporum f. sp. lycopersici 4287]
MAAKSTIKVPHLGGIDAGYRVSGSGIDSSKPTLVLVNSMCTASSLFEAQFSAQELTDKVNLLAIEPLGHGATSSKSEHFTYWDSAIMNLQVMEALGVDKAFALGTSAGGWIVVRMALLAPEKILGVLPLGTSMDYESAESREKGCWDPKTQLGPFYENWHSTTPTPDFVVDDVWRGLVSSVGFGSNPSPETLAFWDGTLKQVYRGDEGRKKLRIAVVNLFERDGLLLRLRDVKCPVYWLQGTADPVFGTTVPAEHIKLFTSSPEATLELVEGGGHYLSATNPKEINEAILKMVNKYA